MGKRRRGKSKRPEELAREVVEGARVSVEEHFALIHQVNPTGRGLRPAREQALYVLKSELQSELVLRFPESLRVEVDAAGVVAIDHVLGQADACHAILSELSPDARSRVQAWLDHAEVGGTPGGDPGPRRRRPASRPPRTAGDPLAAGRAALAEYDFEEAERRFREAADAAETSRDGARELLDLMVQTLADYEGAGRVFGSFAREVRRDPQVRSLGALACARRGELEEAWRLVPAEGQVMETLVLVGRDAADRGDRARLEDVLARLADRAGPERDELSRRRDALLSGEHADDLAALRSALEAGDLEAATEVAAGLAGRDLSPAGAALVRAVDRARRDRRLAEIEARIADALVRDDLDEGARLARRAARLDPSKARRAADLSASAARRVRDVEVAEVARDLASGAADALERWLRLPPDDRSRVDHPASLALRGRVERLASAGADPPQVVDAARRLVRAEGEEDPDGVLRELDHPLLASDPEATELRRGAERTIRAREAERVAALERRAREAMDRDDWAGVVDMLSGEEAHAGLDVVRADAELLRTARSLEASSPIDARDALDALSDDRRSVHAAWRDELDRLTSDQFQLREYPPETAGTADIGVSTGDDEDRFSPIACVDAAGCASVVASGRDLLVRLMGDSGVVARAFSARLPAALEGPVSVVGGEGSLHVLGAAGRLVTLDVRGPLRVAAWGRIRGGLEAPKHGQVIDPDHLWVTCGDAAIAVVHLPSRRVLRMLTRWEGGSFSRLPTDDGLRVLRSGRGVHRVHHVDGRGAPPPEHFPRDADYVVADRTTGDLFMIKLDRQTRAWSIGRARRGRPAGPLQPIGLLGLTVAWVTGPEPPQFVLRTTSSDASGAVVALAFDSDDRVREVWRTPPVHHFEGVSRRGAPALLVLPATDRPWIGPATEDSPPIAAPAPPSGLPSGSADLFGPCTPSRDGLIHSPFDALVGAMGPSQRSAEVQSALARPDRPGRTNALAHTLHIHGDTALVRRLVEGADLAAAEAATIFGGGGLRRGLARAAAANGWWDDVIRLLDHPQAIDGGGAGRHAHHLLGAALLARGRLPRAREVLEAGLRLYGNCPLEALLAAAQRPSGPPSEDAPAVAQLEWLEHEASTALESGEPARAATLLDRPALWAVLDPAALRLLARSLEAADGPAFRRRLVDLAIAEAASP